MYMSLIIVSSASLLYLEYILWACVLIYERFAPLWYKCLITLRPRICLSNITRFVCYDLSIVGLRNIQIVHVDIPISFSSIVCEWLIALFLRSPVMRLSSNELFLSVLRDTGSTGHSRLRIFMRANDVLVCLRTHYGWVLSMTWLWFSLCW